MSGHALAPPKASQGHRLAAWHPNSITTTSAALQSTAGADGNLTVT